MFVVISGLSICRTFVPDQVAARNSLLQLDSLLTSSPLLEHLSLSLVFQLLSSHYQCPSEYIGDLPQPIAYRYIMICGHTIHSCRSLRKRDVSKFQIQLCISLFCMLIVFVSGIARTSVYGGCVTVSVLIHYFTLVAWMWMGALAMHMYKKLVIVFIKTTTRYIIAVSIICWCKFTVARTNLPIDYLYLFYLQRCRLFQ